MSQEIRRAPRPAADLPAAAAPTNLIRGYGPAPVRATAYGTCDGGCRAAVSARARTAGRMPVAPETRPNGGASDQVYA